MFNGREPSSASCLRDPPLTWDNFGKGHLDKHCNGCHSSLVRDDQRNLAPVGVDFDSYGEAVFWADRIWERGVVQVSMPPGGGPSTEELDRFEEWMLCEVLRDQAELRRESQ